jgi:hypothetical protein
MPAAAAIGRRKAERAACEERVEETTGPIATRRSSPRAGEIFQLDYTFASGFLSVPGLAGYSTSSAPVEDD